MILRLFHTDTEASQACFRLLHDDVRRDTRGQSNHYTDTSRISGYFQVDCSMRPLSKEKLYDIV